MLAFRSRRRVSDAGEDDGPTWPGATAAWTVGLEEQVMVCDPQRQWALCGDLHAVVEALPASLAGSIAVDEHAGTLELVTGPHATVAGVVAELGHLRTRLTASLGRLGLRAAAAGSHPAAGWCDSARHEPTFAMHVHVGVPQAESAVTAYRRLRRHVPVLLALSANSPFRAGRETGLACVRASTLAADADDLRVCGDLGTVELRFMDAQTRLADVAALTALCQCLVRHEATRAQRRGDRLPAADLIQENRRRALTDGMRARLHDEPSGEERPAAELVARLVDDGRPLAGPLRCGAELDHVDVLARRPGETFQRALARMRPGEPSGGRRLRRLTGEMSAAFIDA